MCMCMCMCKQAQVGVGLKERGDEERDRTRPMGMDGWIVLDTAQSQVNVQKLCLCFEMTQCFDFFLYSHVHVPRAPEAGAMIVGLKESVWNMEAWKREVWKREVWKREVWKREV